jgi:hypothetical protein
MVSCKHRPIAVCLLWLIPQFIKPDHSPQYFDCDWVMRAAHPGAFVMDVQGRLFMRTAAFDTGGTPGLRVFQTTAGSPAAATGNPFASGLTHPIDGALHPNGNFYFVADRAGDQVGSYRISGTGRGTTLTAASGSPFASGGTFTDALVTNQAGTFSLRGER